MWHRVELPYEVFCAQYRNKILKIKDYDLENEQLAAIISGQESQMCHFFSVFSSLLQGSPRASFVKILKDFHSLSAQNWDLQVSYSILSHPSMPIYLANLAFYSDISARSLAAIHSNTHPLTLSHLSHDPESHIRAHVALHPQLPVRDLLRLSYDASDNVKIAAITNRKLPPARLQEIAFSDFLYPGHVALNPSTPVEALAHLALNNNVAVRTSVAQNPNTPAYILFTLAQDPHIEPKHIIQNPNCSNEIFIYFINKSPDTLEAVVDHPVETLPEEIQVVLSSLSDISHLIEVAKNATNIKALEILRAHSLPEISSRAKVRLSNLNSLDLVNSQEPSL